MRATFMPRCIKEFAPKSEITLAPLRLSCKVKTVEDEDLQRKSHNSLIG